MAGIAGMGSPQDIIENQSDLATEAIDFEMSNPEPQASVQTQVSSQSDEIDYDALVNQVQDTIDYDALVNQVNSGSQSSDQISESMGLNFKVPTEKITAPPEPSFLDKTMEAGGPIEQGLAKFPFQVAEFAGKRLAGAVAGIGEEIATAVSTKGETKGNILAGFSKGLLRPEEVAPLEVSYEKMIPSLKGATIKLPSGRLNTDPYATMEDYGYHSGNPVDTGIPISNAMAIATDVLAGDALIKGATKLKVVGDFMAAGLETFMEERAISKGAAAVEKAKNATAADFYELRKADLTPKVDLATESAKNMKDLSDELVKSGLVKNVDGFDIPVLPSQVALDKPMVLAEAEFLSDQPEMAKFIKGQTVMVDKAWNGLFEAISPYKAGVVPMDVPIGNMVKQTLRQEGADFGTTRMKALNKGADFPVDASNFNKAIDDIAENLGFKTNNVKTAAQNQPYSGVGAQSGMFSESTVFEKPNLRDLRAAGYTAEAAKNVVDRVYNFKKFLTSYTNAEGKVMVPFKQIAAEYNALKKDVSSLWDAGQNVDKNYRIKMTNLKRELQPIYDNAVSSIVGGEEGAAYTSKVEKYSKINSVIEDLGSAVENDIMTASAMSKWAFQKGDKLNAVSRAEGVYDLLDLVGNEKAKEAITSNFVHEAIRTSSKRVGKELVTDWAKVTKNIDNLDPKTQQLLFGKQVNLGMGYNKTGVEAFNDMAGWYSAVQNGSPSVYAKVGETAAQAKINGVKSMVSIMTDKAGLINKIGDKFIQSDKNAMVAKFLSEKGIEDVLKTTPAKERGALKDFVDKYISRSKKWEDIKSGKPPTK